MEFLAHQTALTFLISETFIIIKTFVSDRHASIGKWMREECPQLCRQYGKPTIEHFYDRWHVAKSKTTVNSFNLYILTTSSKCPNFLFLGLLKALMKQSKETGCELIGRWIKACIKHFNWSVTSTKPGLREVVMAKFHSFLYHVLNQHRNVPNKIYNKCCHGDILQPRVWFTKGTSDL